MPSGDTHTMHHTLVGCQATSIPLRIGDVEYPRQAETNPSRDPELHELAESYPTMDESMEVVDIPRWPAAWTVSRSVQVCTRGVAVYGGRDPVVARDLRAHA